MLCLKSMFAVLESHVEFLHGQSILQQSSSISAFAVRGIEAYGNDK